MIVHVEAGLLFFDGPRRRRGTHTHVHISFLAAASHVLPKAIFWEANPTQAFDYSGASRHNPSQPPKAASLDYLVGEREHIVGDFYVKRLCSFEIENERKLGRLFNWQVGWLGTLKDFVDVYRSMLA